MVGLMALEKMDLEKVDLEKEVRLGSGLVRLKVQLPPVDVPAGGYPAVFLLDGEKHFALASAMLGAMYYPKGRCALVALAYEGASRRSIDYTPSASEQNPQGGGAGQFLRDLAAALPHIAEQFQLDMQRLLLFGHSLGGLLVLEAWQHFPELFRVYAASSPSLWYGGSEQKTRLLSLGRVAEAATLLHSVGGSEEELFAAELYLPQEQRSARLGHLRQRRMVQHSQQLARHFSQIAPHYRFTIYAGQSHHSVVPLALADAASWLANLDANSSQLPSNTRPQGLSTLSG